MNIQCIPRKKSIIQVCIRFRRERRKIREKEEQKIPKVPPMDKGRRKAIIAERPQGKTIKIQVRQGILTIKKIQGVPIIQKV